MSKALLWILGILGSAVTIALAIIFSEVILKWLGIK